MKNIVLAAAAVSTLMLGGMSAANAMGADAIPLAGAAPEVTLVSGGCGPAFHRSPMGGCRPNFGRPYHRPFFRHDYRR